MNRSKSVQVAWLIGVLGMALSLAAQTSQPAETQLQSPPPETVKMGAAQQLVTSGNQAFSCPFCQLQKADLSGQNFTDANLQGANLEGANLRGAILDGAMLFGANLRGANLENAKLARSAKGPVDLSKADLTGANLQGAQFTGTDLQYTTFTAGELSSAHLSSVVLGPQQEHKDARVGADVTCGKADLSKLTSRIYVTTSGTDSDTCGASYTQACKTIGKGIARCEAKGCGVLVGWGEYQPAQTIALRDGVNIYGGYVSANPTGSEFRWRVDPPANGQPAVQANAINDIGVLFQGFKLAGSNAGSPTGGASITLLVTSSTRPSGVDSRNIDN